MVDDGDRRSAERHPDPAAGDELWAPAAGDDPGGQGAELDAVDPVWQSADVETPVQGVPTTTPAPSDDEPTAHILIDPEHRSVDFHHVPDAWVGGAEPYTAMLPAPPDAVPGEAPLLPLDGEVPPPPAASPPPDRYYPPGYRPPPPPWRMWIIPLTVAIVGIVIALALLT